MKFRCYRNWAELPQSSDALFANAEKGSVFLSREWFENLATHINNEEQELLLACVIEDEDQNKKNNKRILAILPLLTHENKEWTSFCHPYSSLYSILLAEDQQQEILACLCEGLKDLPFDYLSLAPIAEEDRKLNRLQLAMEATDLSCYRNHKAYNWFHLTQGQSFADYIAGRPPKVRNTIARKQRKLEREHAYEIRLHVDNVSVQSIEQALADYHAIYKLSWKANEQYEALVESVIQRFAKRAWPRLAIMTIDGKPIAAQLWFVVEGKACIFRLVYDEAWKHYSPGSILMSYLLEHVIDTDKVKEIDFLSGNDAYKKDWMSERRERVALVCVKKVNTETKKPQSLFTRAVQLLLK